MEQGSAPILRTHSERSRFRKKRRTMTIEDSSSEMQNLLEWCFARAPGRAARRQRAQFLFQEFAPLFEELHPLITVAGTSGKGTTSALIEAALRTAGRPVGACLKPHLQEFRERIQVQGQPVAHEMLARHTRWVRQQLRQLVQQHGPAAHPSFYESVLIIAASIFKECHVGPVVIEAAVGGENDSSSLLPADLSVVTSVDLDHRAELGDTLEQIARDKAGIAPPGGNLIIGAGALPVARQVIEDVCIRRGVTVHHARLEPFVVESESITGQRVRWESSDGVRHIGLPFAGRHQICNLATAASVVDVLCERGWLPGRDALMGISSARLPGRFEVIPGQPEWILDVAHNPASINALIETVRHLRDPSCIRVLMGATEPHDFRQFVEQFRDWGVPVAYCAGFPKAVATVRLATCAVPAPRTWGQFATPQAAIASILQSPDSDGQTVLVTGSLFLVGSVRTELQSRGLLSPRQETP